MQLRVAVPQALAGAALGPVLDNFHNQFGVLAYDAYQIEVGPVRSALWVPPLFAAASVIIGAIALTDDQDATPNPAPAIALFVALYWLSGYLAATAPTLTWLLWPLAIALWRACDPCAATLLASVATAVAGPAVEIWLTGAGGLFEEPFGHLYHYTHPDFCGVDSWVPAVYFAGGTPVGLLARYFNASSQRIF
ncbi:hypothetical protein CTAYLR_001645 [Chrysophaeum taylorii]|uniref:Uncharacterized protein n=1 Tax=Chrysophaeum taylorii TaxID=2483200 RepID=A0AAD7UC80_9STRA|nr:hypothetical protein CTAYLR_001645 [Chrysophaeum taylorii]